jgi:hypothetical protein
LVDIEKEIVMNNEIIVQNQLTLMNECFNCLQLNELCGDCIEAKEARDAVIAWEIVDEGNQKYLKVPSRQDEPSGHDWTERVSELREQTVWLADRLYDLEESLEVTKHECVCSVCHYTINKHAVCPNCN